MPHAGDPRAATRRTTGTRITCAPQFLFPDTKRAAAFRVSNSIVHAPAYQTFYAAPGLVNFLRDLCGPELKFCPADDPHAYALYYYTEKGDHISFHYDTSYYKGQRFTVLVGLIDESSCRLEYELFRDDPLHETVSGAVALRPGTVIVFNGDKVWHRVSPSAAGERRVALTLEYVTSHEMHPIRRFVSNMKDAIAYFGFRQVFSRVFRR